MRHQLLVVVGLGIAGCVQQAPTDPLCAVIANPPRFAGKRITLVGTAQMHHHGSSLGSEACPGQVLFLGLSPNDSSDAAAGVLSSGGTFFTELAMRRQSSSVEVVGKVVQTEGEPNPYEFIVESGDFR